ncbi:ShlB/FhaC/HecB family hemolysin secretion/activation protein [Ectopseudomonas mendocina]|uniref:ShlB/FhaC/HecB family hemolysin secretion/activation protein n=1 Tax=Ectopseudomonas mendocina TaxID=300 RepID=A0ABZ2RFM4_ECTME
MRVAVYLSALGLLFAFYSTVSLGQTPGEIDLIRERQDRLLQEQQKRLEELRQLPGPSPQQSADPTPDQSDRCFTIQSIELSGATLLSATDKARLVEDYTGKCLGAGQLNQLLKDITNHYLNRGYVTTRAYLPQQDLAGGVLHVTVVEGRLDGLNSSELASDKELAMGFPGKTGDMLNLRELEQLVEQINRLPSRQVQLDLVPGEEVGASVVQLQGQRSKPWRVNVSRHNDGQLSTGEQQWGLGLDWDSPLGIADQLSLRAGGDAVSDSYRKSDNQSLYYSIPYGWWTFAYSYNQSYYRTKTQSNGFSFDQDGDSSTHALRAERVMHRDSVSKTGVSFGLSHVRTNNFILGNRIGTSSQRLSEAQLGINHGRRIGNAYINADIGWQRGIGAFDAQNEGHPRGGEPVARYNKYTLTLSYLQPFQLLGETFSFDSLLNGQRSEDVLFSPQRISLGGLSSIRGYKDQSLTGDTGAYWRNQIRWRRPVSWELLQPFVQEYGVAFAYDVGVISGDSYNPEQKGRLSGNAIELSARGKYLAVSATFARSLERPDALERQEHPVYFRADIFF